MADIAIVPCKDYYLSQRVRYVSIERGNTVVAYVPSHEITADYKHKYGCFVVTILKTSNLDDLKEADKRWLERLGIREVSVLRKVVCISENYMPLHYASVQITKVHDDGNAVGVIKTPPNIVGYEQFFKDRAIFIKTLDFMRLYFLGYYESKEGQARLIRFYTPKTTTDRHYYHMQIVKALQARLPEAIYKRLKKTLNLRIQGEQLVFNMIHDGRLKQAIADFTVPTINLCVPNFDELAKDPVNFLVAVYAEMVKNA